ncbi:hypothetical protein Ate01nite_11920 [Actinoplanes teichomyceticus]|nr:hypothetical protein Ate01nite_11920 [Actinoplanes teichomyceticus]
MDLRIAVAGGTGQQHAGEDGQDGGSHQWILFVGGRPETPPTVRSVPVPVQPGGNGGVPAGTARGARPDVVTGTPAELANGTIDCAVPAVERGWSGDD